MFNKIKSITTQQLKQQLNNNIHLIDVREAYEYENGHIKQSINIPLSTIHQFNGDKDVTYYIICQSGMRSKKVAKYLQKEGYDVINVVGGMNNWLGKVSH